ncbi:MFS transporter [Streptomyces sp. URMC 126]|uniref:MFS transporter n=1 Tax=Streptomyces sp. URMC 126 TaxID=3423401 RepID=UPI003F19D8F4
MSAADVSSTSSAREARGAPSAGAPVAALAALALSVFALCSAEFALVGLLLDVARDLRVSVASAGRLLSAYAVTVAVGGPVVTALTARVARVAPRRLALTLLAVFAAANVLGALAPSFPLLMAARTLGALTHSTFAAICVVIAVRLDPAGHRAAAIAWVSGGLSLATMLGGPIGTAIGQQWGWRATFWCVTGAAVLGFLALFALVPRAVTREAGASARAEAGVLKRPQVLCALGVTAVSQAGWFLLRRHLPHPGAARHPRGPARHDQPQGPRRFGGVLLARDRARFRAQHVAVGPPAAHRDVQRLFQPAPPAGRAAARLRGVPRHGSPAAAGAVLLRHPGHGDLMTEGNGRTGRAVVLEEFGAPPALRGFPVPPAPADGTVLHRLYGGICGTDLHLQQGHLPIPTPLVLGHEGYGTVLELGPGGGLDALGEPLSVGDPVMWASSIACGLCPPCRLHREPTLCENRRTYGVNRTLADGVPLSGSWADHIVLQPGTTVVRTAPGVSPAAAMALACAGPTVVHALYERRPVRLGETVIVQAARWGWPLRPWLSSPGRHASSSWAARRSGWPRRPLPGSGTCTWTSWAPRTPRAVLREARAAAGPDGADLVIECAGVPDAVAQGLTLARRGGSYLVIGQYTDAGDTRLNPHQIVYRQLDGSGRGPSPARTWSSTCGCCRRSPRASTWRAWSRPTRWSGTPRRSRTWRRAPS